MTPAKLPEDSESAESRDNGYDNFVNFMNKLGIFKMRTEERINWIKQTDVSSFLNLLSRSNGKLRNLAKIQRWTGKAAKSVLALFGNLDSPDLEPPDDVERQFTAFYKQMRAEITPDNYKNWAAKLYLAIVFAHMFPNGNGRTARFSYALLTQDDLAPKDLNKNRGRDISELCWRTKFEAFQRVFARHGLAWDPNITFATTDKMSLGDMDFLKFAAANEVLAEDGVSSKGRIELTELSPDQQERYQARYKILREEMYAEVISVVDNYPEYVIEKLDLAVSAKAA